MLALRALLLAVATSAALLVPAANADPAVPTTCAQQDMGPATLAACTPAIPQCVALGFGDGGMVSLCLHEHETVPTDVDGDGYSVAEGDCNDDDPSVFPGATEAPNGIDDDCDGFTDEGTDADTDNDGYEIGAGGDCNDLDPESYPGAVEMEDRRDNDCDGVEDPAFQDSADVDGDGVALDQGDCDDQDTDMQPGAPEIQDGRDNDCNGIAEA